ncbi:hypothetical protein D3C71_1460570 [compost metagenome]
MPATPTSPSTCIAISMRRSTSTRCRSTGRSGNPWRRVCRPAWRCCVKTPAAARSMNPVLRHGCAWPGRSRRQRFHRPTWRPPWNWAAWETPASIRPRPIARPFSGSSPSRDSSPAPGRRHRPNAVKACHSKAPNTCSPRITAWSASCARPGSGWRRAMRCSRWSTR